MDLIDYGGLKINKHSPWDVLASSSLAEEGVEGVISTPDGLVRGHLTIRLDAMLQAIQLPAGITDLHAGLAYMNRNTLTHLDSDFEIKYNKKIKSKLLL